jgi:hypothetical protein
MANEPNTGAIAAIEGLIALVNATDEGRDRHLSAFREALPTLEAERGNGTRLIWILKRSSTGRPA